MKHVQICGVTDMTGCNDDCAQYRHAHNCSHATLPTWPGAETVYHRVANINGARCKNSYSDWIGARKRSSDWRAPDDITSDIIPAMNRGDEEALKAYQAAWPQFWAG